MKTTVKYAIAFFLLTLVSQVAYAMGLGNAKVVSRIGEPLVIEVEVQSESAAALDAASVRVAPELTYRDLGAEYNPALIGAHTKIETRDGRTLIRVQTPASFEDVWLSLVLELSTTEGRIQRHYDLLLDAKEATAVVDAPQRATFTEALTADPATRTRVAIGPKQTIAQKQNSVAVPVETTPEVDTFVHTVQPGDTLIRISHKLGYSRHARPGVMARIVRDNPAAFAAKDPNRLQMGMVLRIPLIPGTQRENVQNSEIQLASITDKSNMPTKRHAMELPVAPSLKPSPIADDRAVALVAVSQVLQERVEQLKSRIEELNVRIAEREEQERANVRPAIDPVRAYGTAKVAATAAEEASIGLHPIAHAHAAVLDRTLYSPVGHSNGTLVTMLLLGILGGFAAGYRLVRLNRLNFVSQLYRTRNAAAPKATAASAGTTKADAIMALAEATPALRAHPAAAEIAPPAPGTPAVVGSKAKNRTADLDFSHP